MAAAATPQNPPFASASLYVGDLAPDVSEALLFEIFNAIGPVASVRVCRDAATRRSLGYAYVNYHRVEDAERALDSMNFNPIRNKPCRIMWSHRDPTLRKSGTGNIFVKNLAKSIDNKALYDTFSIFGNILSCKVALNAKGESLGYGFVHYESDESAQQAIARVNGMVIASQKVQVAPFKSKRERGGMDKAHFTNLYVKNLPEDFTKERLEEMFTKFGQITSSLLVVGEDGKCKGFAFVNYNSAEEASAAVEALNNSEVDGKRLYVGRAQKKEERERELKERFEQIKAEKQKKWQGVNLYVKNLSDTMDKDRLISEFSKQGQITSARVMQTEDGKSRGFGFVCFTTPEEATKAVTEMNGKMIDGKPLYVALAQRKDVRRAQLEAQHARAKMGVMGGPAFFPQPVMFPPQGMPPRGMMFPPQAAMGVPNRGRWNGPGQQPPQGGPQQGRPGPGQQPMMGMPYPMGVPMGQRPGNMAGPRTGGRGGGGRAQQPGGAQGNKQQGPGQGPQGPRRQPNGQPAQSPNGGSAPGQSFKYTQQARNRDVQPTNAQMVNSAPSVLPNAGPGGKNMLTIQALAAAPETEQKQMIGERLFPMIQSHQPVLAGKITGMLLEMENSELLHLLESSEALNEKINEALQVLQEHTGEGDKAEEM